MQTGLGKGCKGGEANGSPTRMEQGEQQQQQQQRYMPHTVAPGIKVCTERGINRIHQFHLVRLVVVADSKHKEV